VKKESEKKTTVGLCGEGGGMVAFKNEGEKKRGNET
jgi:hypothetical protein